MADIDIDELIAGELEFELEEELNVNFDLMKNGRTFGNVEMEDVDNFLREQENVNTKKKTDGDMKVFIEYLMSRSEMRKPEEIPPRELSQHICGFLLAVRKKDGSEYEPTTLRAYLSSLDRYLKIHGINIMKDDHFEKARNTLKAKQKQLKAMGKGNKPKAADPLTNDNIKEMYKAKNIGMCDPTALQNALWLVCTVHFGMRTGTETHNLRWGDVKLVSSEDDEYLVYTQERQTKTRTGENPRDIRPVKPRAYATDGGEEDPVEQYKLFAKVRPSEMCEPDSAFFLATNKNYENGRWYKRNPLGINSLYRIMKTMTKGTTFEETSRITPYSARKHMVQTLSDSGLEANQIIQVSGHRNVNSINNYSKINPDQQRNISHVLSRKSATATATSNALSPATAPADPTLHVNAASGSSYYLERRSMSAPFSGLASLFSGNNIYGNIIIGSDMLQQPEIVSTQSSQTTHAISTSNGLPLPIEGDHDKI